MRVGRRDAKLPRPDGEPGSPVPNGAGDSPKKRVSGPGKPGVVKAGPGTGEGSPDPPGPGIYYIFLFYIIINNLLCISVL